MRELRGHWLRQDAPQHAGVAADLQALIGHLGGGELAGEQGEDELRFAPEDEVRRRGRAEPGGGRACGYLDDHRTAGGAQLDRHRWPAGIAVAQEERGREGEPVAAELVASAGSIMYLTPHRPMASRTGCSSAPASVR